MTNIGEKTQKFKEFVDKQKWTFAKTYAKRSPHEYIVRGKLNGTDDRNRNVKGK